MVSPKIKARIGGGAWTVFYSWAGVVLWCGLIFWLSSIPNYTGKEVNFETLAGILEFSFRKFAHLFEYAVLFLFLYRAVGCTWQGVPQAHFLLSFFLAVVYAISDEIHQSYIFGRSGNGFDVFVDAVGALCGYAVYKKKFMRFTKFNLFCYFFLFPLFPLLVFTGCGESEFRSAKKAEKLGRYPTAIEEYEKFVEKNPASPKSAEALFQIGEIYRSILKDYARARLYFGKVSDQYKQSPWAVRAEIGYMNSPDYFPLDLTLKRRMGDSASAGAHMQMEESFSPIKESALRLKMERRIYAGETLVGKKEYLYEKKDRELREFLPGNEQYAVVLRYPPEQNLKWETLREGKRVAYLIESDGVTVEIKAGIFTNCLKVRSQFTDSKHSWRYDYYAPDAGLILMSVATDKGETRIAELLSVASELKATARPSKLSQWQKGWQKVKELFAK